MTSLSTTINTAHHIRDEFSTTVHPIYWAGRQADGGHPGTPGEGFYATGGFSGYTSLLALQKARGLFSVAAGKLVFPTYTWSGNPRAWNFILKQRKLLAPFTYSLAYKFNTVNSNPSVATQKHALVQCSMLGEIQTSYHLASASNRYVFLINEYTASGQCQFVPGSFAVGDAVQFQMVVEADFMATYQFKVNGVTPGITSSTWAPGVAKSMNVGPSSNLWSDVMQNNRDRFLTTAWIPQFGGELDYLEVKIHDHTL